jgi:hypothetical protein
MNCGSAFDEKCAWKKKKKKEKKKMKKSVKFGL